MKEKFCPRCGEETEDLFGGLCESCFRETSEPVDIPERIQLKVCEACGRVKTGNNWEEIPLEEAAKKSIEKEMNSKDEIKILEVFLGDGEELRIKIKGESKGVEFEEESRASLDVKEKRCEACRKMESGRFEAVLQIRGEEDKVEEALDHCGKLLTKVGDKEGVVSDLEERKNGIDLFLASGNTAKKLAKELGKKFPAERKDSKTLEGLDEGKKVYTSTYLVRIKGKNNQ